MSFFKSIFSGRKGREEGRSLERPQDLQVGDMLLVNDSYALPIQLRGRNFRVVDISTYQFEHEFSASFTLESDQDSAVDLMIEGSAGREEAVFSLAVERNQVESLFNMDQFADIFSSGPVQLERTGEIQALEGWLADSYHRHSFAERGYFHKRDYRGSRPPDAASEGEPFDYYCVLSDDGSRSVEIEVWQDGDASVSLSVHRPLSDIRELWPAGGPG